MNSKLLKWPKWPNFRFCFIEMDISPQDFYKMTFMSTKLKAQELIIHSFIFFLICIGVKIKLEKMFSNFSCMFLNPKFFSNLNSNCSNLLDMRNLQEQKLKKHSVTKNCFDLSLFEWIVLVISKVLQILGLQPQISKVSLNH